MLVVIVVVAWFEQRSGLKERQRGCPREESWRELDERVLVVKVGSAR